MPEKDKNKSKPPVKKEESQASRQDSIFLLNSVNALNKYYQTDGFHDPISEKDKTDVVEMSFFGEEEKDNLKTYIEYFKNFKKYGVNSPAYIDYLSRDPSMTPIKYLNLLTSAITQTKDGNPHRSYYRDLYPSKIDIEAPAAVVDNRIKPQGFMKYNASKNPTSVKAKQFEDNNRKLERLGEPKNGPAGSVSGFYYYDPLAITPWDMLNESQRKQRVKQYGTSGTPLDNKTNSTTGTPSSSTPSHPTTPRINKMPMRGMPSTQINAEPIKTDVPKYMPPAYSKLFMDTRGVWSDVPQVPPKTDGTQYTTKELEKMGYRVSSKDSVPAKATTNKYDFGGLIDYNEVASQRNSTIADVATQLGKNKKRTDYKKGIFSQLKDATFVQLDTAMSGIGLGNVISSDDYDTKWGATKGNKFNKTTGDIANIVAPVVLSALYGPAAGAAYSAGRSLLEENVNPSEFKNGGIVNKQIINIEGSAKKQGDLVDMKSKGELNVDLLGNILQNYSAYNPHPANGMDSSSNVAVDNNTAIIPKNQAKTFLGANKAERQRMIMSIISKQKAKQGPIPKADGGWASTKFLEFRNQKGLSGGSLTKQSGDALTKGAGSSGGGHWTSYASQALSLLGPVLKSSRGLFDKVENINPKEFAVSPNIKPKLINDTASQMMINDANSSVLANLRRSNSGPAALVNANVNAMKQKWLSKQEIEKANAASIMSAANANKQIELSNSATALKIRDMNDMNAAAKRNMMMEGANDFSKYGNQKQYDQAFFDTLPMMADNPQFNAWLKKQGYSKK
jgi:hypothetical protein